MLNKKVTEQEVKDTILKLNTNRSPGIDGIRAEFYQTFIEKLTPNTNQTF